MKLLIFNMGFFFIELVEVLEKIISNVDPSLVKYGLE